MGQGTPDSLLRHHHRPTRRLVLLAALGGALLASPVAAANSVMIVYIAADDCAPCRVFAAEDWPKFEASREFRLVRFHKTSAPKTTQAYQLKYWPAEARPYAAAVKVPIVPSFVLVNNGAVVLVGSGIVGWRNQVLPQIRQLTAG